MKHVAAVNPISGPEAIFEHFLALGEYLEQAAMLI
jgi:hypothetical protein